MDLKILSLDKIAQFLQPEFIHFVLAVTLISWLIYKVLLKGVSEERHKNLRNLFRNLFVHFAVATTFLGGYSLLRSLVTTSRIYERPAMYLGFVTFFWGLIVIVKASRILVFEYLFLSHMRVPVPLLIVNLFTLILSIGLAFYVATDLFDIKLTPLLATSAVLSLVVGLALQDTLGNMFAGVSLQFDKPYSIDDWIEISTGTQKWIGQVKEISWRATLLLSFTEEAITIPNRVMTQSQITNFNTRKGPILRGQMFRMPYDVDVTAVKDLLAGAARDINGVRQYPGPSVLITEVADSWLIFKLLYYIDDYGQQFSIGDRVIFAVTKEFQRTGLRTALPKIEVHKPEEQA